MTVTYADQVRGDPLFSQFFAPSRRLAMYAHLDSQLREDLEATR